MIQEEIFFIVRFIDEKEGGKTTTLKCKSVSDSPLGLGFVTLRDFVFKTSPLVVNLEEENLSKRFLHVKSLHLALNLIMSIEEVGKEHRGLKLEADRSKILLMPQNSLGRSPQF